MNRTKTPPIYSACPACGKTLRRTGVHSEGQTVTVNEQCPACGHVKSQTYPAAA